MTRERRKYPRIELRWPISVMTSDGPVQGETRNIGYGGALIACEYPLPLHSRVCVIFKIPNRDSIAVNTIVARSNVTTAYKKSTLPEVALYFIELTDAELQLLYAEFAIWKGDSATD